MRISIKSLNYCFTNFKSLKMILTKVCIFLKSCKFFIFPNTCIYNYYTCSISKEKLSLVNITSENTSSTFRFYVNPVLKKCQVFFLFVCFESKVVNHVNFQLIALF